MWLRFSPRFTRLTDSLWLWFFAQRFGLWLFRLVRLAAYEMQKICYFLDTCLQETKKVIKVCFLRVKIFGGSPGLDARSPKSSVPSPAARASGCGWQAQQVGFSGSIGLQSIGFGPSKGGVHGIFSAFTLSNLRFTDSAIQIFFGEIILRLGWMLFKPINKFLKLKIGKPFSLLPLLPGHLL